MWSERRIRKSYYYWNKVVCFCLWTNYSNHVKLPPLYGANNGTSKNENQKMQMKNSFGSEALEYIVRRRCSSVVPWNRDKWLFWGDLKTFIWSINSDIFHIVCISIRRIRFTSEWIRIFLFHRVLERVSTGHCVVAIATPILTYSYQLNSHEG